MKHTYYGWTLALSALLALLVGCEGWECGYGGPGCSDPAIKGLCSSQVALGTNPAALVVYFDDTGDHEAELLDATSDAPAILDIQRSNAAGGIVLGALAEGTASISLQPRGWDGQWFAFTFAVVATVATSGSSPDCTEEFVHPDGW